MTKIGRVTDYWRVKKVGFPCPNPEFESLDLWFDIIFGRSSIFRGEAAMICGTFWCHAELSKMVTQIGNAANQIRNRHFQKVVGSRTREHHVFIYCPRRPSFVGTVLFMHLGDFMDLKIGHDR